MSKKKKKLKPLSNKEHAELAAKVDSEGFYYYLAHYGPDWGALERLGFEADAIAEAVRLLEHVEEVIMQGADDDILD